MRYFLLLMAIIFFVSIWVGFVGPFCVSGNTEFILVYALTSVGVIVGLYYIVVAMVKNINSTITKEKK